MDLDRVFCNPNMRSRTSRPAGDKCGDIAWIESRLERFGRANE